MAEPKPRPSEIIPEKTRDVEASDAWIPTAAGECLAGVVTDVDKAESDYLADFYPVLTVREDNGREQKFHAFRTVARSLVLSKRPMIGERIAVTYLGPRARKASDGANNPPVIYRLTIEGRSAESVDRMYGSMSAPHENDVAASDDAAPF